MKWLVLIWAFYLTALSIVPCSDTVNRYTVGRATTAHESTQDHEHNTDSSDECTPFCHCACCSISIAISEFNTAHYPITSFSTSPDKDVALREFSLASDYYGTIWQPPRITA